ncbi:LuxR C-terminal-related transcriptional regulator [Rhodococcus triatomae]|nr:transcriptional regulator [Rhodococcus triatomae BKS 15-14]
MSVVNRPCHAQVPVYGHAVIRRPRLHAALTAAMAPGTPCTAVLVNAPVGSGKTMLLADWVTETAAAPDAPVIAWLTARESDNGPGAFVASLLAALRSLGDCAVADALRNLPGASGEVPGAVAERLGGIGTPVRVVIDDVHLLHDQAALDALGSFLRFAPPTVGAVLAGRFEPPLALHRMRVDGRVRDVPPNELAFTEIEAAQLFAGHGLELDAGDLAAIAERTQGWAVGLRLAAITLARHPDPATMIADFTGDTRIVADYLVGEVLTSLDPDVREFVVETAIPDTYTVELAETLTGNPGSGRIVDVLERENFLIERVPGRSGWYRYHPLLREYLRAELGRLGHRAVAGLEQLAAGWFAESGSFHDALEHTLHAGDADAMVRLITDSGLRAVLSGNSAQLLDLLDRSPRRVQNAPGARRVRAAAELARANPTAAASILGPPETALTGNEALLDAAVRLQLAIQGTGVIAAALAALSTRPVGRTGTPELDAYARLQQGMAELHLGRLDRAESHLEAARVTARSAGLFALKLEAMTGLTVVAAVRCRLSEADRIAADVTAIAERHGLTALPHVEVAAMARMWTSYLRMDGRDGVGRDESGPSADLSRLASSPDTTIAPTAACVAAILGTAPAPQQRDPLADRLRTVLRGPVPRPIAALLCPVVLRTLLAGGNEGRAVGLVDNAAAVLGDCGEVAVMRALIEMRRGRSDAVSRLVAGVVEGRLACITPIARIEALLLATACAAGRGDDVRARAMLTDALALARPHGLIRPFHDEREQIRPLLDRHIGRFGVLDTFAERVRERVPTTAPHPDRLLTARERELLTELPSWRTAEQIAADLFVSVNTVKTHLRGIYRKLGVSTRQEAIAAARSCGLL